MTRQFFLIALFLFCAICGVVTSYKVAQPITPEAIAKQVNSDLKNFIDKVDQEATGVLSVLQDGKRLPNSTYLFLEFKGNDIIAWNDYHFIPPSHTLTEEFELKFIKINNGEFLIKKWKINNDRTLVAVLPLHTQYKIANDYLTPYWSKEIFKINNVVLLEPADSQGYPISLDQRVVFKILPMPTIDRTNSRWSALTIFFFSLSIMALIGLLIKKINVLSGKYPAIGFLALIISMIAIRALMIFMEFPAGLTDSALFDPKNFASSELNPSLGDLFLNSVTAFIVCLFLFRNYYRFAIFRYCFSNKVAANLLTVFSVGCVLFGMLFPFVVVQTIYNNSTITLSISQAIHFDLLRVIALLSVMLAWVNAFFFMHVFLRLLVHEKRLVPLIFSVLVGCLLFIGINRISGQIYFWSFLVGVIYLVCVVSFSLFNSLKKFKYTTFAYFFVAVVCLALNGMFAVRYFVQQNSLENQLRFAGNFLNERDYFGEYLLYEASQRIASDIFIQNRLASPLLGKEIVEQKIRQVSLSGYFNRYNVDVFLYSATGNPLGDRDTTTFFSLVNRYEKETFKTEYGGVYCVTSPQGYFSQKYVVFTPIQKNENTVGYAVIELLLKRVIPKNVYPELLVDNRFQQGYGTEAMSYAIATDRQIQYSAGNFNYDSFVQNNLGDIRLYSKGIVKEKYLHVAMEDINGRIAIISSPIAPVIHWVADFSFQVILGIALILILLFTQGIFSYSLSRNLYLAARIQLILNLAFFLPLIAVSVITLSLTTRSSQEQLNAEFLSKANSFGSTLAATLLDNKSNSNEFESEFIKLATLANLDANVFGSNGKLVTTTQPLIFENNLLAPYINPAAHKRILNGDKVFVLTEKVGTLQFYVAYSALNSQDTGEHIGILAIPFFQSEASLERMQITILSNIISIFTFVFIALLLISFLVTRWLTAPFRLITETMGRISLTQTNKPIQWQSDDEIGLLAREYNNMLVKLNDSKQELERNQRARAWREIAQQVAHEIKNPLTPMKLTLQQLERSLQSEKQQDDKLNKAVQVLLSQVNSLDDIASSFSSFAKMPEPIITAVELVKLLTETMNLHAQEGTILFEPKFEMAIVLADGQLLKRIFSNLILNGIQAARPGVRPEIRVRLEKNETQYHISISDNGRGIDPELMDKIFLPHFTTKQSGSGLGLAITKQGIEQMNGKIRFETSRKGTTFIIELPQSK